MNPMITDHPSDAQLLRDIGNPVRLRILELLLKSEHSVGELVESIGGVAQGRISSHLA